MRYKYGICWYRYCVFQSKPVFFEDEYFIFRCNDGRRRASGKNVKSQTAAMHQSADRLPTLWKRTSHRLRLRHMLRSRSLRPDAIAEGARTLPTWQLAPSCGIVRLLAQSGLAQSASLGWQTFEFARSDRMPLQKFAFILPAELP